MNLPDEMNADLAEILGRANFQCGAIAYTMVRAGEAVIPRKAGMEQAVVIHKLLGFYATHGAEWRKAAGDWLHAMQDRIQAQAKAGQAAP